MNLLLSLWLALNYPLLAKNILISPAKRHTHLKVSSGHTSQWDFPFFPAHPSVGILQPFCGPFISHYQCSLYVELQYFGAKDQIFTECFKSLPVTNMELTPNSYFINAKRETGTQGKFWRWWIGNKYLIFVVRAPKCIHMSKLIKSYTLNIQGFLYINYSSVRC